MRKENKKHFLRRRGFSLIEGVIAIFVLSVGVLAVAGMFTRSLSDSISSGKKITALGLAQEGVELVRALRNNDIVQESAGGVFAKINVAMGAGATECNTCRVSLHFSGGHPTIWWPVAYVGVYSAGIYRLEVDDSANPYYHYVAAADVDTDYPYFWRRIYIQDTGDTIEKRAVVSVVFYSQPADEDAWPANVGEVATKCTAQKKCVFASALLQ